ncbi:hypothetical protein DPM19_28375 [Actinomadura craniellae]|uniref:Uncharacterized protein n=2 Tax=Actinomadura craniellae TaxID=2231787 RepID=A0A365GYJ6_9ACTN|nr:hypothetical protein DPM19_28375 [Actinomadura craniellae]
MARSDPSVTFVVAIVSDEFCQRIVGGRFSHLRQSEFKQVVATVEDKDFAKQAWLYTPRPSTVQEDPVAPPPAELTRSEESQSEPTQSGPLESGPLESVFEGPTTHFYGHTVIGQSNTASTIEKINGPVLPEGFGALPKNGGIE